MVDSRRIEKLSRRRFLARYDKPGAAPVSRPDRRLVYIYTALTPILCLVFHQQDGSWHLPLSHDDPLQPLYRGPPLPLDVLKVAGIVPDSEGSYESCDPVLMAKTCRDMASWKLAGNGVKVAKFAARGGPGGSKNPRKTFGAELADPYALSDDSIVVSVDAALRVICFAMSATDQELPDETFVAMLKAAIPKSHVDGVVSSLVYLRDRIGCPRDLPLASGRYLRAYLNWGIDKLSL